MRVAAIKTDKILPGGNNIFDVLDGSISGLEDGTIVVVTSKIVSLCENRTLPSNYDREELIKKHADKYLPKGLSKYGHHFTIKDNTLIGSAGIDESNSAGQYVLWPKDSQASANAIRKHLSSKHRLKNIGVVIVDSASQPMRRGASGIALAHSGFLAVRDYRGEPDLFGRPFHFSVADISGGLASAAVLAMGEGSEQTPIALISDVPFVEFQDRDPSSEELGFINLSIEDDLFAPFLSGANWQSGQN